MKAYAEKVFSRSLKQQIFDTVVWAGCPVGGGRGQVVVMSCASPHSVSPIHYSVRTPSYNLFPFRDDPGIV